ncbi:hypothetical protein SERLA73DRAFT_191197 [Serpula lacrymans var. lacrymans S7.3]|uniref:Transcription initiation factor IIF subunit beta n=2 Tax=Serpula lacrymans var. lacrymans TaxID=341189 RepID=F8QH30_SERL3|nr:uncharacterized protein SERLADRAFT_467154 [Serpula lacrymans var. lacrymans S7.9]EGN92358.1 hypothetical protein SERLA73DRAFT_191197 [Serpula lacrymans var. lacrymans S7.3]EGO24219.1 hypothetical protein SERLADRAFT_467154 [Serpula lacrymans var. lacrymans S7.9]
MDDIVEDEKKPFDPDGLQPDEETLPDPDEELMLDKGNGRVWLVKVPKHLMERWSSIDAENIHLATVRVYPDAVGPTGKSPRIVLFLPPDPSDTTPRDPALPPFSSNAAFVPGEGDVHVDRYELDMVNDDVDNQLVVAERPKEPVPPTSSAPTSTPPVNNRARTTILTGRIKHECNLRPIFNESYRRQMRERSRKYNTPRRQIRMIEDAGVSGGRGGINRLSSGVGVGAGGAFSDLIKSKPKPAKGAFERMARMPRNQLLDLLFTLFREQPRWSIKPLRERTQQPEAYLKEVLGEIGQLNRSGEYNGMWELSEVFTKDGIKAEGGMGMIAGGSQDVTMALPEEEEEDDDDDDDDDDDMEEVS